MSFTYRLSRRLALAHLVLLGGFVLGCNDLQDPSAVAVADSSPVLHSPSISQSLTTNSSCSNEPPGLTVITDNAFNTKPPYILPGGGSYGWRTYTGSQNVNILSETTAPRSANPIVEGLFRAGGKGGSAPFNVGIKFTKKTTVYFCVWQKLSTNFTNNGNTGTKWGFLRTPYEGTDPQRVNHYFNLANRLGINLQSAGATLNRNMYSSYDMVNHAGVWHRIELLAVAYTKGNKDCIARIWVDGVKVLDQTDVQYFFPNQVPAFNGINWNPTYGGGHNPIPYDMWQRVDHWLISAK